MSDRHARCQVSNFECRIGWHYLRWPVALPRRVERAGIVDLRHLVIGKAENLPQDFIGMFAEQRRTRYFAWAVRHLDGIADGEVFAALGMIPYGQKIETAQRRQCSNIFGLGPVLHN